MPSKFTRTKHRKLSHCCLPLFVTQIKYNCNYNWNISALSHSQSASAVFLSTTHAFCTFSWAEPSTTRIRCCTRCRPHWEHPELQHMTELITLDLIWSGGATDWTNRSAQLISADNTAGSAELLILPQEAHACLDTRSHIYTEWQFQEVECEKQQNMAACTKPSSENVVLKVKKNRKVWFTHFIFYSEYNKDNLFLNLENVPF